MTREPVPHSLMGETAWMLLAQAANDVHHPMRIVTLATIDAKRQPRARLMVLRGADQELDRIWFHTDSDSRKAAELTAAPTACVVAHDPVLGVQLRIHGTTRLHEDNAIAHDHWQQTSMSLRHAYGDPTNDDHLPFADPRLDRLWHHQDAASQVADRRRFVVIEVQVETIEWLQTIGAKQWTGVISAATEKPQREWTPLQSRRRKAGRKSMKPE